MLTDDTYAQTLSARFTAVTSDIVARDGWDLELRRAMRQRRRNRALIGAVAAAAVACVGTAGTVAAMDGGSSPAARGHVVLAGFTSKELTRTLDRADAPCLDRRPPNTGDTPDSATRGMWAAYRTNADGSTQCQVLQGDDTFSLPRGLTRVTSGGRTVFESRPSHGFRVGYTSARYDWDGRRVWLRVYADDSVSDDLLARVLTTARAETMARRVPLKSVMAEICAEPSPPPQMKCPSK